MVSCSGALAGCVSMTGDFLANGCHFSTLHGFAGCLLSYQSCTARLAVKSLLCFHIC